MSQTYAFSGYVQGDNIYGYEQHDFARSNPIHIGVINKIHLSVRADLEKAGELAESYYDRLVELKDPLVQPQPTQEDIIQNQSVQLEANTAMLAQMQATITALAAELKTIKGATHEPGRSRGGNADERGESAHQEEASQSLGGGNRNRNK